MHTAHHIAVKYINPQRDPGWLRHTGATQSYNTQCQTLLLHTSFKLRFNGHIITFPP